MNLLKVAGFLISMQRITQTLSLLSDGVFTHLNERSFVMILLSAESVH